MRCGLGKAELSFHGSLFLFITRNSTYVGLIGVVPIVIISRTVTTTLFRIAVSRHSRSSSRCKNCTNFLFHIVS